MQIMVLNLDLLPQLRDEGCRANRGVAITKMFQRRIDVNS